MASVVKRLVTEWVYRVDTSQLKVAQKEVTRLTGKLNAAHAASAKLFNQEARNIRALTTQYGMLTAAVARFGNTRAMALGGAAMTPFAHNLAGARAAGGAMNFAGSGLTAAEKSRLAQAAMKNKAAGWAARPRAGSRPRAPRATTNPTVGGRAPRTQTTSRPAAAAQRGGFLARNFGPNMKRPKSATALRAGKGGASLLGFGLGGLAAVGAFEGLKGAVRAGAEYELTERNFTMMLKSEDKAADLLEKLNQFAVSTPFQVRNLRESATKLLGSGFNFDGSSTGVMGTLEDLGNISMGSGDKFNRLIMNMADIRNKTTMDKRDVKQFAAVGIDILGAIGKNEGKTNAQLLTMVSQNKITYKMVREAIKFMTSREGRFYNALSTQATSLIGAASNLKDIAWIIAEDSTRGSIKDRLTSGVMRTKALLVNNRHGIAGGIEKIGHGALNMLSGQGFVELFKSLGLSDDAAGSLASGAGKAALVAFLARKMPMLFRAMYLGDLAQGAAGGLMNNKEGDALMEGSVFYKPAHRAVKGEHMRNMYRWKQTGLTTADQVREKMAEIRENKWLPSRNRYKAKVLSIPRGISNKIDIGRIKSLAKYLLALEKFGDEKDPIEAAVESGMFTERDGMKRAFGAPTMANAAVTGGGGVINNQFIPKVSFEFHGDVYGADQVAGVITDKFNGNLKINNALN